MMSVRTQFIGACILTVGAVVGFGIWYTLVSAKSTEVATLQGQLVTEAHTVSRIAAARVALANISTSEAKVQSYFVSEANVVSFINALETVGHTEHATVKVLSVSTGGTKTRPALMLTLTVTGPFDAVMRTVGAIEYMPYATFITTLSVSKNTHGSWHADLGVTVGSTVATTKTP